MTTTSTRVEDAKLGLTDEQAFLLKWLIGGEGGLYGECRGPALDRLLADNLATVHTNPSRAGDDWRIVWPTEEGRNVARSLSQGAGHEQ